DRVERELRLFEQDQPGRPAANDLPAQLAADRSARTRYHDGLADDRLAHQELVGRNRFASQQLFYLDFAKVAHLDAAVDDVRQIGKRADVYSLFLKGFDDLTPTGARRARKCEEDF